MANDDVCSYPRFQLVFSWHLFVTAWFWVETQSNARAEICRAAGEGSVGLVISPSPNATLNIWRCTFKNTCFSFKILNILALNIWRWGSSATFFKQGLVAGPTPGSNQGLHVRYLLIGSQETSQVHCCE